MMGNLGLIAILICGCLPTVAFALTDDECRSMWEKADSNQDGVISGAEAEGYAAALRIAKRQVPENFTQSVFFDNCKTNVFTVPNSDEDAPLSGVNNLTENEAKDRVLAAGFTSVSSLILDDEGVWHGTAIRDGRRVKVAIDYKGNVVAD